MGSLLSDALRLRWQAQPLSAIALAVCLACTTNTPVQTTPPTSGAVGPPSTSGLPATCLSAGIEWQPTNDLSGYSVHDGIAPSDCEVMLVGERVADRSGVLLVSEDAGRTISPRPVPNAARLRRIASANNDLLVLGEDASGQPILFRSADAGRSWASTKLPLTEATDLVSSAGRLVVVGRTPTTPVLIVGDGITWTAALTVAPSASIRALAAGPVVIAVGGSDSNRGFVYTSDDSAKSFRAIDVPASYNAVTGLAVNDGSLVIGGYQGKQVENATALSSRRDLGAAAWRELELPRAVQVTNPVCKPRFCVAIAPTGRADVIVRLVERADRWEPMNMPSTTTPLALERIILGPSTSYAVGAASPLLRARL